MYYLHLLKRLYVVIYDLETNKNWMCTISVRWRLSRRRRRGRHRPPVRPRRLRARRRARSAADRRRPPGPERSCPRRRGLLCRPPGPSRTLSTRRGQRRAGLTSASCCGPRATRRQRVWGCAEAGGHAPSWPRVSAMCDRRRGRSACADGLGK